MEVPIDNQHRRAALLTEIWEAEDRGILPDEAADFLRALLHEERIEELENRLRNIRAQVLTTINAQMARVRGAIINGNPLSFMQYREAILRVALIEEVISEQEAFDIGLGFDSEIDGVVINNCEEVMRRLHEKLTADHH